MFATPAPSQVISFSLVNLTSPIVPRINTATTGKNSHFANIAGGSRQALIGIGDLVTVTIFEASGGGLFFAPDFNGPGRGSNSLTLPAQQVDTDGKIGVPYGGALKIVGETPVQASNIIRKSLTRAIEPAVVVSVVQRRGGVSVLGNLNAPTFIAVEPGGIKILEAIARAGGSKTPPFQTIVTLKRGSETQKALLSNIIRDPGQNLSLSPGDVVYVTSEPKYFMALGSTPTPGSIGGLNNRRFTFDSETLSLAEALSISGGLDPSRANPQEVFLYRMEDGAAVHEITAGLEGSGFRPGSGEATPVIYALDLSRADGFFIAERFLMRDKDILYVAEAPAVGLQRFVNLLSGLSGSAADAGSVVSNVR